MLPSNWPSTLWPKTSGPRDIRSISSVPISIDTGSSGRRKGVASASGAASSGPEGGKRVRITSSADSVLILRRPRSRAVLVQSSVALRKVNQTPSSSAMVSSSNVALDDKSPSKPVNWTMRPSPDSWLSRNETIMPPSSSASWAAPMPGASPTTAMAQIRSSACKTRIRRPVQYRCRASHH